MTKCRGYVCKIAEDISRNLNFEYVLYVEGDVLRKRIDLIWEVTHLNIAPFIKESEHKNMIYSCMRPIRTLEQFIFIFSGAEYGGYEKLLLPFDEPTWILIAFTFGVAFATVVVGKFSRTMQNL